MIEGGGVELYELHVADGSLGTVDHGYAVAGGDKRVGGGGVDGTHASGGHYRYARQESVYASGGFVEHVCAVAGDVGGAPRHYLAQVVLRDDFYGEVVLVDVDERVFLNCLDERELDFGTSIVGMV